MAKTGAATENMDERRPFLNYDLRFTISVGGSLSTFVSRGSVSSTNLTAAP
jgi:hypothetical protein